MNEDAVAVFIPIVAIIMSLSIPIVFAILEYRRRRDIVETHHKERMAAIERGVDVPPLPDAFFQPIARRRRTSYLLPGMIWLFIGIALFIFIGAVAGDDVRLAGLLPIAVGAALLLYHFIEGRKLAAAEPTPASEDRLPPVR